jgi:hypothetical protein
MDCCVLQLVDTTVEIANKVGAAEIVSRVVDDLKDEAEQYRKMVMETIEKIMSNLGAADIDSRLEEQLIDGILYAFQEQTTEVGRQCYDYIPSSLFPLVEASLQIIMCRN